MQRLYSISLIPSVLQIVTMTMKISEIFIFNKCQNTVTFPEKGPQPLGFLSPTPSAPDAETTKAKVWDENKQEVLFFTRTLPFTWFSG